MSNNAKIVVIGAGPSGISAATKLVESGFSNVVVLEAEDRIGGRIHTIPFGENVIDMGAQWCHGEKNNIVYDLATQYDLLESTGDVYEDYKCIRSNREIVPENVSERLKAIVNDTVLTRKDDLLSYEGSLGTYLSTLFDEGMNRPENSDICRIVAKEFFDNYMKFENSVEASDSLFEVSGKSYLEYYECDGDILLNWKDKGYVTLLNLLMKSNGKDFGILSKRIKLKKSVECISWDRNRAEIKCTDGDSIITDHVICTVSLGVLKERQSTMFKPALPTQKSRAIEGLAFGTVNKIFLEFPTPFWPKDWTGFTLLWRDEELQDIRETSNAWLEDVFGFYIVNYQPNILASWIIGPHGRHMETLPEDEILKGIMLLLRKFLSFPVPNPISCKTSAWYTNPNFRGSYSYRSLRTEELDTYARDLAAPLSSPVSGKPVLQFAGEASSEHYYSTVHGAVEAGWREADRLVDYYSLKKSQL